MKGREVQTKLEGYKDSNPVITEAAGGMVDVDRTQSRRRTQSRDLLVTINRKTTGLPKVAGTTY